MKKIPLTLAGMVLAAGVAMAYTETKEFMTVTLKDGQTIEYLISDVEKVDFESRTDTTALVITDNKSNEYRFSTIPTLFCANPTEAGEPTRFGFGTVGGETPAALCSGGYAVELAVSPTALWTADLDLSGDQQSVVLTLYKYTEMGAVDEAFSTIKEGKLSTSINRRTGEVTILLDATLKDGYTVFADMTMSTTDVESLDAMNPAPVYINELVYFNHDGKRTLHANVTGAKRGTYHGQPQFVFTLDNGEKVELTMNAKYFGEPVFLPDLPMPANSYDDPYVIIKYEVIQVASPNTAYRPIATNAYAQAQDNNDGTWTFNIDATNTTKINPDAAPGGTPERFVFNYSGVVE